MSEELKITVRVPSDAQSRGRNPYLEHTDFIKYCKANHVDIHESELEQYEKNKLLFPCYRILYPRELLQKKFRASITRSQSYKIHNEWTPLLNLEESMLNSRHWLCKEFKEAIEHGHPFEQAIFNDNPYLTQPSDKFKHWHKYKVSVGKIDSSSIKESRAKHYYSPWKVFFIYDLKALNTDEYNRATGLRRGWGIGNSELRSSSLTEFNPFFKTVSAYAYRRSLLDTYYYFERTTQQQQDWNNIVIKKRHLAQKLFSGYTYDSWIRFIRKLIEIYENYRGFEKILLSLEVKSYIARSVIFLRYATDNAFEKICEEVSGKYKEECGLENGVLVYPGSLEKMFPNEKWDLEQKARWLLNDALRKFNSVLHIKEKLPESFADNLFDDLANEPTGTALASIRKIDRFYNTREIWRDNDFWSGIRDLAVSIEVHGKEWIGGNKLNDVLQKLFPSSYDLLKAQTGIKSEPTKASNKTEFLQKLKNIQDKSILAGKRCGSHLLVANLTRNYSSHQKGLSGKDLHVHFPIIYSSLVRTLFLLYAKYKGML